MYETERMFVVWLVVGFISGLGLMIITHMVLFKLEKFKEKRRECKEMVVHGERR